MSIEITMPRLSDTMETGTIIKWNVKEGDEVASGDVLADVETDKATMEMQAYDDGTVARILVEEGKTVDVGSLIAVLAEEDEDVSDVTSSDEDDTPAEPAVVEPPPVAPPPGDGRIRVSPVARQLAEEHRIDVRTIQGSGPSGRIIKRDVLKAVEAGAETRAAVPPTAITPAPTPAVDPGSAPSMPLAAPPVAPAAGLQTATVPLSNMRQVIAKRLVESKTTIPHYQVTVTFDMDPLLGLRGTLNEQLVDQGVKLSVNDFLIRACALSMYKHPEFNASFAGDHLQIHGDVNVGMAIALPAERGGGLVVATIRNADHKSLRIISQESRALAEKARTRGLSVEEMADCTFTLSNLGMFGVDHFTAIINPPNSAILAVGGAPAKPVVRNGELTIGHEMSATLSLDHRVIDGAMAAQYLQTLKQMIEHPSTLLV
jgi:pyruvate dehydrogenase E2 component (dihydrolipoamide acetyltransferase)